MALRAAAVFLAFGVGITHALYPSVSLDSRTWPSSRTYGHVVSVPRAQSVVGSTPLEFSVTDSGDASFTIPIPLPPATHGFSPQLSVEWTSSSNAIGYSAGAGAQVSLPIISRR